MSAATRAARPAADRTPVERGSLESLIAERAVAERPRATAPERVCRYCCAELAPSAKKCRWCGEWAVHTSGGVPAALLRLLALSWVVLSAVAAGGVWLAGTALRTWLVARAVDPVMTPVVLTALLWALVAAVLLQGLTVGAALGALAGLLPRRPRWWS